MAETGKSFQTKLTVTSKEVAHQGTSKKGNPFTIWEVFAVDEAGQPVEHKLRTFEDLPEGELLSVKAEEYVDDRRGTTYTLSTGRPRNTNPSRGSEGGLAQSVDELRARVDLLERQLATAVSTMAKLVELAGVELEEPLPEVAAPNQPTIAGL